MELARYVYEFVLGHPVEVVVTLVLLYPLLKLVSSALNLWRIHCAFRTIPCDPEQHFFLGHGPKYVVSIYIPSQGRRHRKKE
jgi:hypothetical protein